MAGFMRLLLLGSLLMGLGLRCVPAQLLDQSATWPAEDSLDVVKKLMAEHAYAAAQKELTRLLSRAPQKPELLTLEALNDFYQHRYVESRRIVQELTAQPPVTAEVRVLSGLLYVVSNDLVAAESEFRAGTEADSRNAAAHYYYGRTLYMRQAIEDSINEFRRALALDPTFIQAYDALGLAYVVEENTAEAKNWFLRGMKQEQLRGGPQLEWLRLDLAAMLLKYGLGAEAAVYLAEAERINPKNPQVYTQLGQLYFQDHRYADAIVAYATVLQLDPVNALAHYFRGRSYHFLGEEVLSKAEFVKFNELNQQHTMFAANPTSVSPGPH